MGTASIAELIGCSYSKVIRWVGLGFFGNEQPLTPGSGCTIILDHGELEQAWACARLSEMRATKPVIRRAMETMRKLDGVSEGDVLVVWASGAELMRRTDVMPADPSWVIPLLTSDEILDGQEWRVIFESDVAGSGDDAVFTALRS